MENMKKVAEFEEKLNECHDLVDIAYSYCTCHYDKSSQLSALGTILTLIRQAHKDLIKKIDELIVS